MTTARKDGSELFAVCVDLQNGKVLHDIKVFAVPELWKTRKSVPTISSPVIVEGLLFMVGDQGGFVCSLAAKTGAEIWKERLGQGRSHWASPQFAGGKVHFFSKEADVTEIAAARESRVLSNHRFDEGFVAGPAVAGDALILRSESHLYCVAEGREVASK